MLSFTKQTGRRILIAFIGLASLIGCDPMARYEFLSFFFDGVPDPNSVEPVLTVIDTTVVQPTTGEDSAVIAVRRRGPSRHKPGKDCQRCHGSGSRRNHKQLNKPIPALCYDCHNDYTLAPEYVHGPVAVGDCLFCHDAHESRNEKLLKEPLPLLCYQCHPENMIASVAIHQENPREICTKCHDPHRSLDKMLLRSNGEVMDETETHNLLE